MKRIRNGLTHHVDVYKRRVQRGVAGGKHELGQEQLRVTRCHSLRCVLEDSDAIRVMPVVKDGPEVVAPGALKLMSASCSVTAPCQVCFTYL
jgi:hypothetical protein